MQQGSWAGNDCRTNHGLDVFEQRNVDEPIIFQKDAQPPPACSSGISKHPVCLRTYFPSVQAGSLPTQTLCQWQKWRQLANKAHEHDSRHYLAFVAQQSTPYRT